MRNAKKTGLPADAEKVRVLRPHSPAFTPDEYREMLSAISEAHSLFIEEPGRAAFDRLLDLALRLTESEYGFIGEVLQDTGSAPYLKERATRSRAQTPAIREFFDRHHKQGFELHSFDNLFGTAIASGQPIVVNDPLQAPRKAGLLPGHPEIRTFLGLPLFQWDEVVGIIGLVNRAEGYSELLAKELEPISTSCASLILASRNYTARQRMETALYESEKKRRLLFENSRDALMVLAPPSWKFVSANQAALDLLGAASKEQFTTLGPWNVSPQWQPDGRLSADKLRDMIDLAMRTGVHAFECELRRLNGDTFSADVLLTRVENGRLPALQATVRDITAQRQARLALQQESEKSEILLRVASDGVHILDGAGYLKLMSDSFCRMLGYSRLELKGMHVSQWDVEWSEAGRQARAGQLQREGTTYETRHQRKDGALLNVEVNARSIVLDGVEMLYCSARDVTERKLAEKNFIRQANYDSLTRLPNRNLFRDRLELEVKKSHRSGWPMALMLLDLDRFKEVNDTLGHDKGDLLLVEAARRIVSCVRESDTVARLGGDEFTVILSELDDTRSVDRIAQKIVRRLAAPFQLGEDQAFISASIGITLYPNDATDIEALLKNADQAMYLAKNQGRNRFCFFTAKLQEAAQKRMRLSNDLRNALLAGNQFRVHYQPIVELATGSIHKAEALVRWQHPTRGLISPAEFIPLAEETGMIVEIGDWVFQRAMQQCKQWRATHHPAFQISVNRSPVQFQHDASHSREWISYLQQVNIPGQCLVIEITEGLLLNVEGSLRDKLLAFRDAGIQVAIDDFGTGYSSLSYLNQLDIDYLKIDQSFIRNLEHNSSDMALCEAIVIMAHKLGLKAIAEGVSTEGQRDLLMRAGCDYAQGYLYSKPVAADEFEKLLQVSAQQ